MSRILRLPEIMEITGYRRSTIYLYISQGIFPRPVKIGRRAVGWPISEVLSVMQARIEGKGDTEVINLVKKMGVARHAS